MRPDAINWQNTSEMVSMELTPRQTIRRRLLRCLYAVVIFQTVVAIVSFSVISLLGRSLVANHVNTDHLKPTAEAIGLLATNKNPNAIKKLMRTLGNSEGVQFAVIHDATSNTYIHPQIQSPESWDAYRAAHSNSKAISNKKFDWQNIISVKSYRTHEIAVPAYTGGDAGSRYTLVVSEVDGPSYTAMLLGGVGIIGALGVTLLLVVPLIYMRIKRWTIGLNELIAEMQQFSKSGKPRPMSIGGQDEVGFLFVAYNDLASRLLQSRQRLVETNEALERQVDKRTEELQAAAIRLEEVATHDSLTGLANRRVLDQRLNGMYQMPIPADEDIFCMLVDMDGFKGVNDTLGHKVGDEILCLLAGFLKRSCRQTDVAVRYGGDEFILLLKLKQAEHAMSIADRIQKQFGEAVEEMLKGMKLETMPSLSFGVAGRKISECTQAEDLILFADKALYRAKDAGKARALLYHQDMAA